MAALRGIIALTLTCGVAASARAQTQNLVPPPTGAAGITLDFGFTSSAGNTTVTTMSFGQAVGFKAGAWELKQAGAAVYGRTADSTTAEQLKLGWRADYRLFSVLHAYAGIGYERNRFAGIGRKFEQSAGVSFRFIDRPRGAWVVEAGSTLNQQRNTADVRTTFGTFRLATVFKLNVTPTAFFQQTVETLPNIETSSDVRVNSESILLAPLSRRFGVKLTYLVKYDHLPEPGFRKSDRVFSTVFQVVF
jgi:putative salt-induced outer membrane protein YdiY